MNKETYYKDLINEVPDFPKKGVSFKDISPLLASTHMFRLALMDMLQGHNNDLWAGVDSRGFLFASGLSQINGGGVLMIRKKGKLPPPVCSSVVKTDIYPFFFNIDLALALRIPDAQQVIMVCSLSFNVLRFLLRI